MQSALSMTCPIEVFRNERERECLVPFTTGQVNGEIKGNVKGVPARRIGKSNKQVSASQALIFLKCTAYFCVLFGEEVNKRESSVGTSPRHLLRQPQCFDFSKCATKRWKFNIIYHSVPCSQVLFDPQYFLYLKWKQFLFSVYTRTRQNIAPTSHVNIPRGMRS